MTPYAGSDRTAQSAAEIGNQYPSLRPGDCVHIATVRGQGGVRVTYDGASVAAPRSCSATTR